MIFQNTPFKVLYRSSLARSFRQLVVVFTCNYNFITTNTRLSKHHIEVVWSGRLDHVDGQYLSRPWRRFYVTTTTSINFRNKFLNTSLTRVVRLDGLLSCWVTLYYTVSTSNPISTKTKPNFSTQCGIQKLKEWPRIIYRTGQAPTKLGLSRRFGPLYDS